MYFQLLLLSVFVSITFWSGDEGEQASQGRGRGEACGEAKPLETSDEVLNLDGHVNFKL